MFLSAELIKIVVNYLLDYLKTDCEQTVVALIGWATLKGTSGPSQLISHR